LPHCRILPFFHSRIVELPHCRILPPIAIGVPFSNNDQSFLTAFVD
jgi:hypothetical protein